MILLIFFNNIMLPEWVDRSAIFVFIVTIILLIWLWYAVTKTKSKFQNNDYKYIGLRYRASTKEAGAVLDELASISNKMQKEFCDMKSDVVFISDAIIRSNTEKNKNCDEMLTDVKWTINAIMSNVGSKYNDLFNNLIKKLILSGCVNGLFDFEKFIKNVNDIYNSLC